MPLIWLEDLRLNVVAEGPETAPPVVLIHALGQDLTLWEPVSFALRERNRVLRLDLRGHGQTDAPPAPYAMGALIRDVERAMDHFALKEAVVVGLSIGGLIAQGLAVKRLDLVRGLVLSNTAARIGTAAQWQARIDTVRLQGLEALAESNFERWFGRKWRENPALPAVQARFLATRPEGWMGCAAAIAGTDFYETTATLRLPLLAIAGANDGSTPPDLVRETAELVPGSDFALIRGAGHLPMTEKPWEYIALLEGFLARIGHR